MNKQAIKTKRGPTQQTLHVVTTSPAILAIERKREKEIEKEIVRMTEVVREREREKEQ